jgi:hypothetical protein
MNKIKNPVIIEQESVWVPNQSGCSGEEKSLTPTGIRTPDLPVYTLYRLSYRGSKMQLLKQYYAEQISGIFDNHNVTRVSSSSETLCTPNKPQTLTNNISSV